MTTETKPKRPTIFDNAVREAAANDIAPKVLQWLNGEPSELSEIVADLVKAMKYNDDGYEIAKHLEDYCGYSPDSALVDILDGTFFKKRAALDRLCREWVADNSIQEIPVGSKVTWSRKPELGVGVVSSNKPEGKSVVKFESEGHVTEGVSTGGYIVEWENLTIVE